MPSSNEAKLASQDTINYQMAMVRAKVAKSNFVQARPSSVVLLGHSNRCYYAAGTVVYAVGSKIRMLDIYGAVETELVVDVRSLLAAEACRWPVFTSTIYRLLQSGFTVRSVMLQHGILAFKLSNSKQDPNQGYLFVVNVRKDISLQSRILMIREYSENDYHQEVHTDGRYLILTSRSPRHTSRPGWAVDCYNLEDNQRVTSALLRDITGRVPGRETHFRIYDGWFYILCNQHKLMPGDEGDEESYYYCYRFPLDDIHPTTLWKTVDNLPSLSHSLLPPRLEVIRVQRQLPWTSLDYGEEGLPPFRYLDLLQDPYTGGLLIIEGSEVDQSRTEGQKTRYYFQPIMFPHSAGYTMTLPTTSISDIVHTVNVEDLPPGYSSFDSETNSGNYRPSINGFCDSVIRSEATPTSKKEYRFRLSVGSCRHASPLDNVTVLLDGERLGGVFQFPPKDAPESLQGFFCPRSSREYHYGASTHDVHSIISMTGCPSRNLSERYRIIFLNFDPWIRFQGLEKMELIPLSHHLSSELYRKEVAESNTMDMDEVATYQSKEEYEENQRSICKGGDTGNDENWLIIEPAKWKNLRQGFEFTPNRVAGP